MGKFRVRRVTYSKAGNTVGGIIMLVVGIGVLIGGFFYTNSLNSKIANWKHTTATVVDYVVSYNTGSEYTTDPMYSEVLEYTANGRTVTVKNSSSSNIPPLLNVKKEIAYNPDDPTEFVFAAGKDKLFPQIMLFVVGGLFTVIGTLLLISIVVKKVKANRSAAGTSESPKSEIHNDIYDMYNGDVFLNNKRDEGDNEPYEKLHYGDE